MDVETFEQLRTLVRRFVRERLVPREAEVALSDHMPPAILEEMREIGLFGLSIPQSYGGLGLSLEEEVRLTLELGWTSPAFRSTFGTNVGIGSQAIIVDGTPEQKARYLPVLASGRVIGAFALTEPDAGSDIGSLRTRATRDGDDYVINGRKRFITNAPSAGLFTVFARTDPSSSGAKGVSAFLVDADTPGLLVAKPDRKMGQQGVHTADVVFEDCRVPSSAVIGGIEGVGFRTAMKVLDRGRITLAAGACGLAERLIHEAIGYATERRQFGRPIAEFQLVQAMLADSRAEAYAATTMVLDAASLKDSGADTTMAAACCKYFATEMVGRVADRAVQIFGGAGYVSDSPVERFYRDVRLLRIYEGTSQIQQLVIAREMLKKAGP
ncbi:MAG: acyl-CoA dehydrogenase family protein [Azospirillaceae bacterium]